MHTNPAVTIVLPCYNPVKGWLKSVETAMADISKVMRVELILVNDGSNKIITPDEVSYLEEKCGLSLLVSYQQNRGKGYALRQGVKKAQGEIIIYTDIDFPYTHHSFINIYETLIKTKCDVAVGIRGNAYYRHLPQARVRISKFLRFFIRKFLRIPTDDTQCGLKGFNQNGKEIFLQTTIDRYLFDLEFIFSAARKKLRIKTVEVELREDVHLSHMPLKVLAQEAGNFLKIFVKSIFGI